jgi:hypothetical protein
VKISVDESDHQVLDNDLFSSQEPRAGSSSGRRAELSGALSSC